MLGVMASLACVRILGALGGRTSAPATAQPNANEADPIQNEFVGASFDPVGPEAGCHPGAGFGAG